MHANAIANGVVVSFPSKMLTHRKIAPAAIKPKLAMMKRVFSIFFIAFSPSSFSPKGRCVRCVFTVVTSFSVFIEYDAQCR